VSRELEAAGSTDGDADGNTESTADGNLLARG
jgi:hypothetical protein